MTSKFKRSVVLIAFAAGIASTAQAQSRNEIYGSAGTEGLGIGYGYGINKNFGARVEVNGFSYSRGFNAGDLHYNANIRLVHA